MFDPGLLINDRYRLDASIAAGGMGQVWRATDVVLGRTVAVKLLRQFVDETAQARFRNEARAMAALQHPGVAGVYDYGETELPDGTAAAYIVMACVDGQPLSTRILEAGRLDAAETASIIAQAARALQAVHDAGVVHRDVKPANMVVEPDGSIVLIDFGVAVTADAAGQTRADEVVGTALYMAPEQVTKQELTPATDIYALGAVAYHCLTGRPPFEGGNAVAVALAHLQEEPPPLPDSVPANLRQVVMTAMAKDPGQRYATGTAMADAIEDGRTEASTAVLRAPAVPPATEEPPRTPPSRLRRRAIGALLVGVATLLTVLALADPTGVIPLPGDQPQAPAATGDTKSPADTDPAGGAGGERQTTSRDPATSPGPTGDAPGTAPDGRNPGTVPEGGDDAGEPAPTPSPEPSGPSEPSSPPASDDDETGSADPEPTTPTNEQTAEPASSPAGQALR
jgi:serine/threonine-protein kinase